MIKYTPEEIAELLKFETSRIPGGLGLEVWEYHTRHVRGTIMEKLVAVANYRKIVRQLIGEQDD